MEARELTLIYEAKYVVYKYPEEEIEVLSDSCIEVVRDIPPEQVEGEGADIEIDRVGRIIVLRIIGTRLYSDGEKYIIKG